MTDTEHTPPWPQVPPPFVDATNAPAAPKRTRTLDDLRPVSGVAIVIRRQEAPPAPPPKKPWWKIF